MIEGDEGKPMSFLESISDEPVDCDPYLSYLIEHYRGHREYWRSLPDDRSPDKPTTNACVIHKIDYFILQLELAQGKLRRERERVSRP